MDFLRVILGRVVGGWVASLVAWLTLRYGIEVSNDQVQTVVANVVTVMMFVFTTLYAVLHKAIDRKLNPGDVAKERRQVSRTS